MFAFSCIIIIIGVFICFFVSFFSLFFVDLSAIMCRVSVYYLYLFRGASYVLDFKMKLNR